MTTLKQDINEAARALKGLTKKIEQIQKQIAKLGKPTAAKARPAKKAVAKKAPARKAAPKKARAKRAPAKKAAAKKPGTAVATITAIINRSRTGIDVAALMVKTGYNKKKVANLIFKLKNQKKIKNIKKGVYTKA